MLEQIKWCTCLLNPFLLNVFMLHNLFHILPLTFLSGVYWPQVWWPHWSLFVCSTSLVLKNNCLSLGEIYSHKTLLCTWICIFNKVKCDCLTATESSPQNNGPKEFPTKNKNFSLLAFSLKWWFSICAMYIVHCTMAA